MPRPSRRIARLARSTPCSALALVLVLSVSGCKDKAQAKYEECVALEADYKPAEALAACKAAVELSPDTTFGQRAAGKVIFLESEVKKLVESEKAKTRPCKAGKWVTHCKWKGKPRPNFLEANTYAKCNQEADEVRIVGMTCPECECADDFVSPYKDQE